VQKENFSPPSFSPALDWNQKEAGEKLGVKNGSFQSLVAASPRWVIRVPPLSNH